MEMKFVFQINMKVNARDGGKLATSSTAATTVFIQRKEIPKKIPLDWKNYFLRNSTDIEFSIKSNVVEESIRTIRKIDETNFPIILHFTDNKENINSAFYDENIIEIDFSICHGEIIEFCHY